MNSETRNYPPGRKPAPSHHEQPRVEAEGPDSHPPHAQDHWRVNLAEPWEITFWTREFGCSEWQLHEAVQAVGNSAGAVRAQLAAEDQQQRN
jgi:AraC-like DNA-binding protein